MDHQAILEEIEGEVKPLFGRGKVANYIPALARVPAESFAMAVAPVDGREFAVGQADTAFSIQSISKVFTLMLAMSQVGDALWERVGREPSGNPFNSLVQLEYERGIPRNPMINAGALVVVDILMAGTGNPKAAIRSYLRRLSGNPGVDYDPEVAASEEEHRFLNAALANFLKSHGNMRHEVEAVLDAYFHQCALAMSARDLARAVLVLANKGVSPASGEALLTPRQVKRINAVMLTCGLYDAVGNFAYRVGLPGKSGVGGGIVAVMPGELSLAVWAPELDPAGNSYVGTAALELFTTKTGLSIF